MLYLQCKFLHDYTYSISIWVIKVTFGFFHACRSTTIAGSTWPHTLLTWFAFKLRCFVLIHCTLLAMPTTFVVRFRNLNFRYAAFLSSALFQLVMQTNTVWLWKNIFCNTFNETFEGIFFKLIAEIRVVFNLAAIVLGAMPYIMPNMISFAIWRSVTLT